MKEGPFQASARLLNRNDEDVVAFAANRYRFPGVGIAPIQAAGIRPEA